MVPKPLAWGSPRSRARSRVETKQKGGGQMSEAVLEGTRQPDLASLLAVKIGIGIGTPADVEQLRRLTLQQTSS